MTNNENVSVLGKAYTMDNGKKQQDTRTPKWLFDKLHRQFQFDLDPCDSNRYPDWLGIPSYNLTRGENGLELPWHGNVFVNPPWGKIKGISQIPIWIDKAERELSEGDARFVVFLLPSRVETKWWHHLLKSPYLMNLTYLQSRVKFADFKDAYVVGISIITLWRGDL